MAAIKIKMAAPPATFEEWVKLVDLHEAYSKHTMANWPTDAWMPVDICTGCGWMHSRYHRAGNRPRLTDLSHPNVAVLLQGPTGKYILRKLMPQMLADTEESRYADFPAVFGALPRQDLEYLYDSCAAPWAALELARKTSSNMAAYRQACLQAPRTAFEWSKMTKQPDDECRRKASESPHEAIQYAEKVDREYHVVTRMGAMKTPNTALRYLRDWGSDFALTDKERKMLCRTKIGACEVALIEKVARPEYQKALHNSTMYGAQYIYQVVGERCPDMEAGTKVSFGYDCVEYMSIFGVKLEDMQFPKHKYNYGPYTNAVSSAIYLNMLKCQAILAHTGSLTPDDITTVPYRHRSAMAIGYVYATHSCPDVIWNCLKRARAYRYLAGNLMRALAQVNCARARRGLPQLAIDDSGVPAEYK